MLVRKRQATFFSQCLKQTSILSWSLISTILIKIDFGMNFVDLTIENSINGVAVVNGVAAVDGVTAGC